MERDQICNLVTRHLPVVGPNRNEVTRKVRVEVSIIPLRQIPVNLRILTPACTTQPLFVCLAKFPQQGWPPVTQRSYAAEFTAAVVLSGQVEWA